MPLKKLSFSSHPLVLKNTEQQPHFFCTQLCHQFYGEIFKQVLYTYSSIAVKEKNSHIIADKVPCDLYLQLHSCRVSDNLGVYIYKPLKCIQHWVDDDSCLIL